MEETEILTLYRNCLSSYNEQEKNQIWEEKSKEFRDFWNNKIVNNEVRQISIDEIDQVIRILDRSGKGNTKGATAVAKVMVPQGAWRRMFNEIKTNESIRNILTAVLKTGEETKLMNLIDELYRENEGKKNNLTGPSANVVNAMLFAYNPTKYISVVSLNDRKKIITYFKFPHGLDFEKDPIGKKVVLSNKIIIEGFKMFGISSSPRTISTFLYTTLQPYWKSEIGRMKIGPEEVQVSIPDKDEIEVNQQSQTPEARESIKVQAKIAQIGETLGFKIWLPNSDRTRVMHFWKPKGDSLLAELPLVFDDSVLKIIRNIDVLWVNRRYIVRAFEVEHKTSIYSGILRMGDLLALQPNLNIKIHLVAPSERKDDVFNQVNRPVFADISGRKLSEVCSYLSYDSINLLASEKQLRNMKESVIDDYTESPSDLF